MRSKEILIDECKRAIRSGDLENSFEVLRKALLNIDPSECKKIEKDIDLFEGEWRAFSKRQIQGTENTEGKIPENRIRKGLYDLLEVIEICLENIEIKEIEIKDSSFLVSRYKHRFYYFYKYYAKSIRLIGADDEYFSLNDLSFNYCDDIYLLPSEFKLKYDEIIEKKIKESKEKKFMFYNGKNTRLLNFHATPVDDTEKKKITLSLGPVWWFDFTVANDLFGLILQNEDQGFIERYINLDKLINTGRCEYSKLSNLVVTASTILTADGKLLFTKRSEFVSSYPNSYTSAIAENIRPEEDGLEKKGNGSIPIFSTVIRGIKEELSPIILEYIDIKNIKLLGITFDLGLFHPDFLLIVFVPLTYNQIVEIYARRPGKDFIEAKNYLISLDYKDRYTTSYETLFGEKSPWVQGGKASLFRSIEFLESIKYSPNMTIIDLIKRCE